MFPPERPVRLMVVGMRFLDRWEKPPKVEAPKFEVEVNGKVVWRGAMFQDDVYRPFTVELPTVAVRRSNTFKIRNPGPAVANEGRPVIHYVVIRK